MGNRMPHGIERALGLYSVRVYAVVMLALAGCQQQTATPIAVHPTAAEQSAQPIELADSVVPPILPVAIATQAVAQLPAYTGPCSVCTGGNAPPTMTVQISGNQWRGTSLDGTYTLTRSDESRWSYSLPTPIAGAVRLDFVVLGSQRVKVAVFEAKPHPTAGQAEYSNFNWFKAWPNANPTPGNLNCMFNGLLLDKSAGGVFCPVPGTATVTAN